MNISLSNYAQSTKGMNIPSQLKEGHNYVLENSDLYDLDTDIKEVIDLHISAMNKITGDKKVLVVKPGLTPQNKGFQMPKIVKELMPLHQQKLVQQSKELQSLVPDIEKMLSKIPLQQTPDKIVFAHYFYAGSDWFITSLDPTTDELMFGYVILNRDAQMSEEGSIYIDDLKSSNKIELDFHWTPVPLEVALYKAYPKEFPAPKQAQKKQAEKVTAAEPVKKKKLMKGPPLPSRSEVTPDVSIIKKWMSFHKKAKTKNALLAFIKAMQKAIADKAVRASSKYADILREIQTAATVQYNGLANGESIRIEFKPSTLKKYTDIVGNTSVYKSLSLIKRFIGLQGNTDAAKINRLLFAFEKTKLAKDDPYKKEVERLKKLLKSNKVSITKQELSGLEGILNKCGCMHSEDLGALEWNAPVPEVQKNKTTPAATKPKSADTSNYGFNDGLFVKASDTSVTKKAEGTFRLGGEIGEFMGDLQQYKLAIAVTGDPHAGKTQLVFQLAEAFMNIGKKVGMFDLEQGGMQSKDTQEAVAQWISKIHKDKLEVAPEAPKGIDSIREYADLFDVIFIDSWQKLKLPNTAFDNLRNEFPNTIFIVIFQQNAEGTTRGGNASDYDANVRIKVVNVDDSKKNNYALMIKNRGNKTGHKYNWATQKLVA